MIVQLVTPSPAVSVAVPPLTAPVATLVNWYVTWLNWTLLGFTPGNRGEGIAVPVKTLLAVRKLGVGKMVETEGGCLASKSAVKTRFGCMTKLNVGLEFVVPLFTQLLKIEEIGFARIVYAAPISSNAPLVIV